MASALLLQAIPVVAGTTGGLRGQVVDSTTQKPLADAKVTVASPSETVSSTADASGQFSFVNLAPDTYTVTAEKQAYDAAALSGITVTADQTQSVIVALTPHLTTIATVKTVNRGSLVKPGQISDVYTVTPAAQAAAAPLGGGTNLNSALSAVASVPGVYVPIGSGALGWGQSVNIRGGDYTQTGFEVDGVPINRAFDQYQSTPLSSLGNQEVQVYTGAAPADAQANGLAGYINQVISRGGGPFSLSIDQGVGGPIYYHKLNVALSGSTKSGLFSYYAAFGGYNQLVPLIDKNNGASYFQQYGGTLYNYSAVGCASQNPSVGCYTNGGGVFGLTPIGPNGYAFAPFAWSGNSTVADREGLVNIHVGIPHKRDGSRDDVQLLLNTGQTYDVPNDSMNDWGSVYNDIINGTITQPNGTVLAPGTCGAANTANVSCAAPVSPIFLDNAKYSGPLGVALTASNLSQVQSNYFAGSSGNRPFSPSTVVPIPNNQADGETTGFGIAKLQYTKNFSSRAYAQVYGYTLYSNRLDNGAVGLFQNYAGAFPFDYTILSHTAGGALLFADQITDHHLLQFDASYTTSNTTRDNNELYAGATPVAYLVSSANPTAGCYTAGTATSGPATQVSCGTADQYAVPGAGGPSLVPTNPVATVASAGGFTCGSGPCEFLAAGDGGRALLNTVKPEFSNFGLQDTYDVNSRLNLNFGVRFENFTYIMRNTNTPGDQLLVSDYNSQHCIAGTTISTRAIGSPCAAGTSPTQLTASSSNLTYTELSPRIGGTYRLDPNDVLRFSYGRFTQPSTTAAVQSTTEQPGTPSAAFYANFGFAGFTRAVEPEISYNTDLTLEHQFKNSDTSFSITPFLRKTQNEFISILVDPKTNFVADVNGLNRSVSGFEFAVHKGDFERNGLAASLAYTYTHATAQYKVFPTGGSFVNQANQAIQGFNAYTSFCAANPTNAKCGATASGAAASPCYTTAGAADPTCAAGSIVNPYWNASPGALLDPNASYPAYNQDLGTSSNGGNATSYVVPDVFTLILNYKHNKWAFTPAVQVQAGAVYGSPLAAAGIQPDTCTAALTSPISASDPRYNYGLPTGSGAASGYNAASCVGVGAIPDPFTKQFDGIGTFTQPTQLVTNLQITYQANPLLKLRLTAANLYDRCFGGTNVAWGVYGNTGCAYSQGLYVGNFFNPGDSIQPGIKYPYGPVVGGALQSINASTSVPFALYFDAELKI